MLLDGIILNGDISNTKAHEREEESGQNEEIMNIDETQESDENDVEATSIEIDDEDSNESTTVNKATTDISNRSEDEIHSVDNTDDEVDEIVDEEVTKKISYDDECSISKNNSDTEDDKKKSVFDEEEEKQNSIILNDSGDADIEIIENDLPKENGKPCSPESSEPHKIDDDDDDDVITVDTPIKKTKKSIPIIDSPRRSARNLNRKVKRTYIEREREESSEEESDVEEVMPQDPLAVADPLPNVDNKYTKKQSVQLSASSTIVVKDTKRLVEIASKSNPNNSGKKEPTLVIIDTNSILSGRGPIPINQKSAISQPFPVLPMALPAQGVYPPNMRATITPIPPLNSSNTAAITTQSLQKSLTLQSSPIQFSQIQSPTTSAPVTSQSSQPTAPILPSLTDDMFVVEAPSFIVPYVYEKPPVKDLKEFVQDLAKELKAKHIAEEKQLLEQKESNESSDKEVDLVDEDKIKDCEDSSKRNGEDLDHKEGDVDSNSKKQTESEKAEIDTSDKSITQKLPEEKHKSEEPKVGGNKLEQTKVEEKKECSQVVDVEETVRSNKPYSYFDSPLGKFFVDIGHNLVQEFVQTDLLKQQKRKREREGGKNVETNKTITSLIKNLEYTKENNEPYHMPIKKCEFCSFKTESALAMSFHLETPHMKNFVYRCNFCPYEIRSPHDILFHMEAEHMIRGRLERAPAFHQCPSCPFEDNQKGKLSRHLVACSRKFKPDRNLEPPLEWEPPAKIPRVPRIKQSNLTNTAAMYQAMAKNTQYQLMQKMQAQSALNRGRGRPSLATLKHNMIYKSSMSGGSVLLPTNYQLSGNQLYQVSLLNVFLY